MTFDNILYLPGREVLSALPSPLEAVGLVRKALISIGRDEAILHHEVIHPRPGVGLSSIVGALPAVGEGLAGQKWVSESVAAGITAMLMMNDAGTGVLHTIMDARHLTGLRTAAVSGACVQSLGRPGRAAIVGTGLQCRYHLLVLAALGYRDIAIAFRQQTTADEVRTWAGANVPDVAITFCAGIEDAVRDASVVVTAVRRGATDAVIPVSWLRNDALLLPVDFSHCIQSDTAGKATLLATDHIATYNHAREHGALPGYPAASCATGTALTRPSPAGLTLIQNLGNAACDLVIADHVRRAALANGAGVRLER
jgi:ornithine cyclodeaminase/alanine dehydrogenase-like protein (mu-crystallin family)